MAHRSELTLPHGTKVRLTVMSREAFFAAMVTRRHRAENMDYWATIHVMNMYDELGGQPHTIVPCDIKHLASLTLAFDDTSEEASEHAKSYDEVLFQRTMAFFDMLNITSKAMHLDCLDVDIHCTAGMSRSTAIAAAMHRYFKDTSHGEAIYFEAAHPNPLVVSYFNHHIYGT